MRVRKMFYKSSVDFNKAFKRFIWRNDVLEHFLSEYNCGWNDGGCRSLMKALMLWLGEENVETYQIVKSEEQLHSEHGLIKAGNYFLDGDGVSTYSELKHRWLTEELLTNVIIRPFEPYGEPVSSCGEEPYYIFNELIEELSELFSKRFDKDNVLKILKED